MASLLSLHRFPMDTEVTVTLSNGTVIEGVIRQYRTDAEGQPIVLEMATVEYEGQHKVTTAVAVPWCQVATIGREVERVKS